jgi:hypothetical protein
MRTISPPLLVAATVVPLLSFIYNSYHEVDIAPDLDKIGG